MERGRNSVKRHLRSERRSQARDRVNLMAIPERIGPHASQEALLEPGRQRVFSEQELAPAELYTDAWYRSRLEEDRARSDETAREVLKSGGTHYAQEFRCRRS